MAAALQAQRLMVKYSIDPSEVEDGVETRVPVCVESEWIGDSRTWRFQLATVVRRAFRCECHEEFGGGPRQEGAEDRLLRFRGRRPGAAMTFELPSLQAGKPARPQGGARAQGAPRVLARGLQQLRHRFHRWRGVQSFRPSPGSSWSSSRRSSARAMRTSRGSRAWSP